MFQRSRFFAVFILSLALQATPKTIGVKSELKDVMVPTILVLCEDKVSTERFYVKALRDAGWDGEVVMVNKDEPLPSLNGVVGLLLTGGADIHPRNWDPAEAIHPEADVDEGRDNLEITTIKKADERQLPILGICRGEQVLNVAFGGSLHQHLPDKGVPKDKTQIGSSRDVTQILPHAVAIKANSKLAKILEASKPFPVNSRHHQAVKKLGQGLIISAVDPNTLVDNRPMVEGIESADPNRFIVGVQWHPENLVGLEGVTGDTSRNLFKAFVTAVRDQQRKVKQ